jgi:hypothetical protein
MTHEGPNLRIPLDVFPIKPITTVLASTSTSLAMVVKGARAFEHLRRIVLMDILIDGARKSRIYHKFIPDELALAFAQAGAFNLHVLSDAAVELGGIRFAGATLWTDYGIFGEANQAAVMNACAIGMNDHRLIGWQKKPWLRFRPQEAALLHHRSKSYLEATLSTGFDGPTVVITHTAVNWNSILPKYRRDPVTAAFVSDMSATIEAYRPALWVHGHVII